MPNSTMVGINHVLWSQENERMSCIGQLMTGRWPEWRSRVMLRKEMETI